MPDYTVVRTVAMPDYNDIPRFSIDHYYDWEGTDGYAPKCEGQLFFRERQGFELVMWCEEKAPRALYHNPNDPVHTDSCMEGFIWFYPELQTLGYLSVEMNANGASHCSFGTGRHTRSFVVDRDLPHPEVQVERMEIDGRKAWRARVLIRLPLLKALYNRCDFVTGHKMKANFYKCGNHTARPHWGSWSPISRKDFHSPEHFGALVIE